MDALDKDPRTVEEITASYRERGPTTQFITRPMHLMQCQACGEDVDAEPEAVLDIRRATGDGEDAIVSLLECPACSARGTLLLVAGESMPEEHAGVLAGLVGDFEGVVTKPL